MNGALVTTLVWCLLMAENTVVPSVVGKTAAEAKSAIEAAGLTAQFQVGRAASKPEEAFTVLEVKPKAGTTLTKGSAVRVTLAARHSTKTAPSGVVPDAIGRTAGEARAAISAAGLVVKFQLGKKPPLPHDALRVYACEPVPGSKLPSGGQVRVTIYADGAPAARAEQAELLPTLQAAELPPDVAKAVAELQARETEWLARPPTYLKAKDLNREFANLRWAIAKQLAPHDIPGAISYARASVNVYEARPVRWEQLGDLYNFSGALTSAGDAANAYENALFLEPTRHQARLKLGSAYLMNRQPELSIKHFEYYLCVAGEEEESPVIPVYAAACAAAGQFSRGIAFCQARAMTGGDNRYRIAWAILEKASGNRKAAVGLLTEVEKSEDKSSPLNAYAARLRESYGSSKGAQE